MNTPVVTELFIYPIKSCAGISVDKADVVDRGLRYDRRWMVTDTAGRFLSQRTHPRLAMARIGLLEDRLSVISSGIGSVSIPLETNEGSPVEVEVWQNRVQALRAGAEVEKWFGTLLGESCWVVFMPDSSTRRLRSDYALGGEQIAFSDAFPLLLLSEASLDDLNRRLPRPIPMNRFRPNIVVGGCQAYDEDFWKEIRIGSVPLTVAKSCARCATTTVDQTTGIKSDEPLRTLASYRNVNGEVMFGQNLVHRSTGTIRVEDICEVIVSRDSDPAYAGG